jgi:cytochrome c556
MMLSVAGALSLGYGPVSRLEAGSANGVAPGDVEEKAALNSGDCRKVAILGLILVGSIALVPLTPCRAENGLDAAKHRQAVMDRLGDDIKAIKLYVAGAAARSAAVTAAQDLETTAPLVSGLFPPGSDSKTLPGKSAAKPEIWDNPDDFQQLEQALTTGTANLRKTVDAGDVAAIQDSMRSLAKNACGACHENYRGRKDGE